MGYLPPPRARKTRQRAALARHQGRKRPPGRAYCGPRRRRPIERLPQRSPPRNKIIASRSGSRHHDKMQTKLAQVQAAMAAGDWPRAFSIASKFQRLGRQKAAIMRAQAARLSPGLYRQLGRDPAMVIEEGKAAMRARFEAQ